MLKLYNTLTRKKEIFKPLNGKRVNLFVCGPTVYDSSHIGHARTYIAFDMIVKYLKKLDFDVFYLQNITDIDDKIIKRAKENKTSWKEIAKRFEKEYLAEIKKLKIDSVSQYARATDHIKEIISQIERLLKNGYAYEIDDGIYFDISKFKNYGKLSGRSVLQAEDAVSRIDENKKKKNKGDFCLWKFYSGDKDEPKWQSPWQPGRPGWHIEDTAITEKYFGPQYDIHGGARDLIFPHHEAEIAQMETVSKKSPMVRFWLHAGFLTINSQKMAKSLGNFVTIKDFLKEHPARLLRFFFLKSHYRSPVDYSEKAILNAKKELERIDEFLEKLNGFASRSAKANAIGVSKRLRQAKIDFGKALDDDFNTPKALAVLFMMIRKLNAALDKNQIDKTQSKKILDFLKDVDKIFNFIFPEKKEKIPQTIKDLAKKREKLRKQKKWAEADKIRKEIEKSGFEIKDTVNSISIRKR